MESFVVISSELTAPSNGDDADKLPSYDSLFVPKTPIEAADPLVCQLQREADSLRARLNLEMENSMKTQ